MNKILLPVLLIQLLLLLSCSGSKVLLEPNYKKNTTKDVVLAVLLNESSFYVNYDGDLKPEFGEGNSRDLILNFFKTQLPLDIKKNTTFKEVTFTKTTAYARYKSVEVVVWRKGGLFGRKTPVLVNVPDDKTKYTFDDADPDYILILDNVSIGTEMEYNTPMVGPTGMMMGGGVNKFLNYVSDFVLWDNAQCALVAYGHIERSTQNMFPVITLNTWKRASEGYVQAIFYQGPFRNFTPQGQGTQGVESK